MSDEIHVHIIEPLHLVDRINEILRPLYLILYFLDSPNTAYGPDILNTNNVWNVEKG